MNLNIKVLWILLTFLKRSKTISKVLQIKLYCCSLLCHWIIGQYLISRQSNTTNWSYENLRTSKLSHWFSICWTGRTNMNSLRRPYWVNSLVNWLELIDCCLFKSSCKYFRPIKTRTSSTIYKNYTEMVEETENWRYEFYLLLKKYG